MQAKRILYIGNKLSAKGFTPTAVDSLVPLLQQEGYDVIAVSEKVNPVLRMLDMMYAVVQHRNVDVVLIDVYSTAAFYYAYTVSLLCRILAMQYVPILHGGNLPNRFKHSPTLCKHIFGYSATNVAVSPFLYKCLEVHSYKRRLIPNSILLSNYLFKQRVNIEPSILWVRSFHKLYNPQLAIRAFKLINDKHPDAKLTMVGPDKDGSLELCKALCVELGIVQAVVFTGKMEKQMWVSLSQGSDIFLNTSTTDNMPLTLIEAKALGLPVVSTSAGGIRYMIRSGGDGLLVDEHTPQAIANAVEQLLANDKLPATISFNSRASVEQYNWELVKQEWHSLLQNVGN